VNVTNVEWCTHSDALCIWSGLPASVKLRAPPEAEEMAKGRYLVSGTSETHGRLKIRNLGIASVGTSCIAARSCLIVVTCHPLPAGHLPVFDPSNQTTEKPCSSRNGHGLLVCTVIG